MKIVYSTPPNNIARVFVAELDDGKTVEFVESVQPPLPKNKKWVLIVSTLFGCPVKCAMCDAGNHYNGKLSADEILAQIDYLVQNEFGSNKIPVEKFKIQFARTGEPAFNMNVLDVLEQLPNRYDTPGLLPSISSIAPVSSDDFFERLINIKNEYYQKRFQLQFSIHTTDEKLRDKIIPIRKWNFDKIAEYGNRFYNDGDQKIGLNFALEKNSPLEPEVLLKHFDPKKFIVKITPINPTYNASSNKMRSFIDPHIESVKNDLKEKLQNAGYDVIINIGEVTENQIGSNCGQYVMRYLESKKEIADGYDFEQDKIAK